VSILPARSHARDAVLAAALYTLAMAWVTWPLFRHPSTTVIDTRALYGRAAVLIERDIYLTTWILAWDTHALTHDPTHLFQANVFYPAPSSLARSEHMLGSVPLFAPVYLATGNPILAHQWTLLATFVLAGLAMAAWVLMWTGDRTSAFVAGLFYLLAPSRLWQMGNLHVAATEWLPVVAIAVDALIDGRARWRAAALLAVALVFASGCSYYLGYAAFLLAGVYAAVRVVGRRAWSALVPLGVAGAGAVAAVGALSWPYLALRASGGLPSYGEGQTSLALLAGFKFPLGELLGWFVRPRHDGIPQFLTLTAVALALIAIVARRGRPTGAMAAVTIVGVALSLGPYVIVPSLGHVVIPMPYQLLAAVVPGFSTMRAPQRFGALATLGTIALAGLGLAWLRAQLLSGGRRVVAGALAAVASATFLFELTPWTFGPSWVPVGAAVPPAYQWLAAHGDGGPLLELPLQRINLLRESRYMYYSTYHWLPLLNGYSSYPPASWLALADATGRLPDPAALDDVLALHPRWILLHREALPANERAAWEAVLGARLARTAEWGDALLFERRG
jgi:hypothetical protein